MGIHVYHEMHDNSRASWEDMQEKLSRREREIFDVFRNGGALTDREVLHILEYHDMNSVRPPITRMVKAGLLEEADKVRCRWTGKSVRQCRIPWSPPAPQQETLL